MRIVSSTVTGDHLYIVGQCQFSSATEAATQLDHLGSSECGVRTKIDVGTVWSSRSLHFPVARKPATVFNPRTH